jgi:low affinity Fe/Cu permease
VTRSRTHDVFRRFAARVAHAVGTPWAFAAAVLVILVWVVSGPMFHWSDTWQLVINTSTTIVTFLVVFLIQNTQNRDAKAIHLKLDELIWSIKEARNALVDVEDLTDEELEVLAEEFKAIHARAEQAKKELGSRRRGERHPHHSHGRRKDVH